MMGTSIWHLVTTYQFASFIGSSTPWKQSSDCFFDERFRSISSIFSLTDAQGQDQPVCRSAAASSKSHVASSHPSARTSNQVDTALSTRKKVSLRHTDNGAAAQSNISEHLPGIAVDVITLNSKDL